MHLTANGPKAQTDWNSVDWRKANRIVRNLRQRIFRAVTEGDYKRVRSLQKLMLRCYSNLLLSVRRVTQQSRGRHTAGIDRIVVKTASARGKLVDSLLKYTSWVARPARRVYIPKSNGKLRPLGIVTISDRCLQAVVKNALEPEWEAQFECSSYGFRPGRSPHDAIKRIYNLTRARTRRKWILKVDLAGCFDHISHDFLLSALGHFPAKELIQQWLKAGYMDNGQWCPTNAGTPQGAVLSPLLANIAMHGIEATLGIKYYPYRGGMMLQSERAMVRFADDLCVFCRTKTDATSVARILRRLFKDRGLSFSKEKTSIVHLSEGFDYLGFHIQHYPNRKTGVGWKLLIQPSLKSVKKIREKLKQVWLNSRSLSVDALIRQLNPIVRGQANYLRVCSAGRIFSKLDHWMYLRQRRFVKHRHPHKAQHWLKAKYWGRFNLNRPGDNWVFGDRKSGVHLLKFGSFRFHRHVMVTGTASPDDPRLRGYWHKRAQSKHRTHLGASRQSIAKRQDGLCPICGESLFNDEDLHLHHITPLSQGGGDQFDNLQLLHLFCHQQVHSNSVICS